MKKTRRKENITYHMISGYQFTRFNLNTNNLNTKLNKQFHLFINESFLNHLSDLPIFSVSGS